MNDFCLGRPKSVYEIIPQYKEHFVIIQSYTDLMWAISEKLNFKCVMIV